MLLPPLPVPPPPFVPVERASPKGGSDERVREEDVLGRGGAGSISAEVRDEEAVSTSRSARSTLPRG